MPGKRKKINKIAKKRVKKAFRKAQGAVLNATSILGINTRGSIVENPRTIGDF